MSMEFQQQERNREKPRQTDVVESRKQSVFEPQQQATTGAAAAANSPPVLSASSSPSHEFSFTISLNSAETTTMTTRTTKISSSSSSSPTVSTTKTKHPPPPLAIDLSPADEIFFHGHLLPLHFLSHLHASSPRPSTHSLDSYTPPNKHILREEKALNDSNSSITCSCSEDDHCIPFNKDYDESNNDINSDINIHNCERSKDRSSTKSKSFSLFGLTRWKKRGSDNKEKSETTENRRKLKFDVSQFVKRYINMVKPLLSPRAGRRDSVRVRRQSYSFSGMVSPRDNRELMQGRRGEFSAPASMRTSPMNSGLLATAGVPSPVSDSTMEELQAAIQAAIAHCKNSISAENNNKSPELSSVPVN